MGEGGVKNLNCWFSRTHLFFKAWGSSGNQHDSLLLLGLFVTLSRGISPDLVLLRGRTDVNPVVPAAEPSSLVLARYAVREGSVNTQGAHLGMFMPSREAVCVSVISMSESWC